ncbi:hypothetical protein ACMGDF_08275 [Morganella morganii]|uniref:SLOG domain-containing protein n=1 Tax=Morganella morganii TaxID=582 RepID=UPI003EBC3231
MGSIFLSASIPVIGRGHYHETANPFLIQCAVRELVIAIIRKHKIVWGGHPAITPMIWNLCEDLGQKYSESVILYQSNYFEDRFPEETALFNNVIFTPATQGDRDRSLEIMREAMLSRDDLVAAVFIGGMDGVEIEYNLFKKYHPSAKIIPLMAPGGAALDLAKQYGYLEDSNSLNDIDFASIFYNQLIVPY